MRIDIASSWSINQKFQWRVDEYWPSYDGRYVLLRQPVDDLNSFVVKQEALYAVYDTHEMYV